MSKKEGKGLKSFNKGFQVPDTYIIIFLVVVVAALLTFLVPKGFYETQDISYMINGVEKTRTVIKDGSFQYLTDDAGNVVTEGVALFSGDGGTGFFNYMYNGIVSSSAIEIIAFLMVVGGAFGIMIRTGAIESGLIGLIRKAKGAEKLLIPILFVLFSLGGAVFGMGEEALPFTMILCPLFVAVGYDSVIAVLVTYVATQIGKLADESAQSAVNTRELIMNSIQEIENGNRAVEKTSKTIIELVQGINEVAEKSKELEELSETQTEQMKQAEAGVNQISEVVQSNAAIAEESSATSEELSAESISLNELVQQFKLKK